MTRLLSGFISTVGCLNERTLDEDFNPAINVKEPAFKGKEYNVIHHGAVADNSL